MCGERENMKLLNFKMKYLKFLASSEDYVKWLRAKGVKCGEHTKFFDLDGLFVDTTRPYLLEIGDWCKITKGVIILTHDYSRSVLRRVYGEVINEAGKTVIGDNVFIGMNAVILMGSNIGDNCIIGAGAVVSGNIPANSVVAGNPARVVRTLEEHYERRRSRYVDEARLCAKEFYKAYGRKPTIHDMGAFFPLYLERDAEALRRHGLSVNMSGDDPDDIMEKFLASSPVFENYEQFLDTVDWDG